MNPSLLCIALVALTFPFGFLGEASRAANGEESLQKVFIQSFQARPSSEPLAGVRFVVREGGSGPDGKVVATGVTDGDGEAQVWIPKEALLRGEAAEGESSCVVMVEQEGCVRSVAPLRRDRRWRSDGNWVGKLWVERGRTVFVRLVDRDGEGVDGAMMFRSRLVGGEGETGWLLKRKRLGTGWFAMDRGTDRVVDLWGWKADVGAGLLVGTGPLGDGMGVVTVPLQGAGKLEGTLTSPAGGLLGRERMFFRKVGSPFRPAGFGWVTPEPGVGLFANGLGFGFAQTDEQGRFLVEGLAPGEYEGFVIPISSHLVRWEPFGPATIEPLIGKPLNTTAEKAVTAVYQQSSLRVRLLHSDGSPWAGNRPRLKQRGASAMSALRHNLRGEFANWPGRPRLLVRRIGEGGATDIRQWSSQLNWWADASHLYCDLLAGQRYSVQVVGGPFAGEVHLVTVPKAGGECVVDVEARQTAELGSLKVTLDGRAADPGMLSTNQFRAYVSDLESGAPILGAKNGAGQFRLPAGTYRVVVEGVARFESWHGSLLEHRTLGRAEKVVEVFAGRPEKVDFSISQGGTISLTVDFEPDAKDWDAVHWAYSNWEFHDEGLRDVVHSARVEILADNFVTEAVPFAEFAHGGSSAAGTHLLYDWPAGEKKTSAVLPEGCFTLVVTTRGGRRAEREVEIEAGENQNVSLDIPK